MNVEEYLIGSPAWFWPAVIAAAVLSLTTFITYWRQGLTAWRGSAMLLKLTAIAILAICLVEPQGRGTRPRPRANLLPIIVDHSQSMNVANASGGESDAARLRQRFTHAPEWLTAAEQMFDVRRYLLGERLRAVETFADLDFDANATQLRSGLQSLQQRFANRPVAGVVLFTDGNATDDDVSTDWSNLGYPVFPVRDVDDRQLADLRFDTVGVSETTFETAPVTLNATIAAEHLEDSDVLVRLIDPDGELVEEQTLSLTEPTRSVQFRFRPPAAGISFYELQCVLADEPDALKQERSRFEATLANNRKLITVTQQRGPFEVLYVAGRPNWEFKFLRRALQEDAEVRLVGLLRIAKKQPKFSFRDANVDSSANPLFAGLGGDEEEAAEQLDEAVVVRLGVKDASELPGGFPDNPAELFPFSAVILDDVEAGFFSQDQLLALRQFVSVRGGSLLMLGGDDALEKGNYADTPLGELAPVYFPRRTADDDIVNLEGPFRYGLTRQGMLEPFLRLRPTEDAESQRLRENIPLRVLNQVGRVKPGAAVLAEVTTPGGSAIPALVTQPFGRGTTAALPIGDLWRWSMHRDAQSAAPLPISPLPGSNDATTGEDKRRDDPAQLWRQTVRWLVSDVPRRIEARAEPSTSGQTVRIEVDVLGDSYTPLDDAIVEVEIEQPDAKQILMAAEPMLTQAGRYAVEFWPRARGGYRAAIKVKDSSGQLLGTTDTGWTSDPAGREWERIGSNRDRLESIATQTGGRVLSFAELRNLTDTLSQRPAPIQEAWVFPLWHRWWICALALLCLCGEWGIRRWKGLA